MTWMVSFVEYARDRRTRRREDVSLGVALRPRDGRAARRLADGGAGRDRRRAGPQRRGQDHPALDPRHAPDPRSWAGDGAGPRRRARGLRPAPAAQHGERAAVVSVEPARRRDRRVLRAALRAGWTHAPAPRRLADRALRARALPPRAVLG